MGAKGLFAFIALFLGGLTLGFAVNWFLPSAQSYDLAVQSNSGPDKLVLRGLTHEGCQQAAARHEQTETLKVTCQKQPFFSYVASNF